MKGIIVFLGLAILAFCFAPRESKATELTGIVTYDGHPVEAIVAAIPYDPQSFNLDSEHPIVSLSDAQGRYELTAPDGPYILVATDGVNCRLLDAAVDPSTTLDLQTQPDMVIPAGASNCYCSPLFWGLYLNVFWDSSTGWRWSTITRGCGCICR